MENPSTFSLFKLPLVATEHVFSMFNPFELIHLSLTSIRARKFVSYFYKSKFHEKFRVTLKIAERPSISLVKLSIVYEFTLTSDKSKEGLEEIYDMNGYYFHNLYKYSEDMVEGFMEYYENLKKVFECEIGHFDINTGYFENRSIIDWLKKQQNAIDQVAIDNTFYSVIDDDVKYFLDNIKVLKKLFLYQYNARGIGYQLDLSENVDYLQINFSNFLTLENLLKLKSRKIILHFSSLTKRDLNVFLKSWMSCESHLNLEQFEVDISGREAMTEILDLPHEKKTDPDLVANVQKLCHKRLYFKGDVSDIYEVKRSDGKLMTVCLVSQLSTTNSYYWGICLIIH